MRRVLIVLAAVPAMILPASSAHAAHGGVTRVVLVLPEAEARVLLERGPSAVGLGVHPGSRSVEAFLDQIGTGAPPAERDPTFSGGGAPGRVAAALGGRPRGAVAPSMRDTAAARILPALGIEPEPLAEVTRPPIGDLVRVLVLARAQDADAALSLLRRPPWPAGEEMVVLGIGEQTPVVVGWTTPLARGEPRAILGGGLARRTGVVTPWDIAATILGGAGLTAPGGGVLAEHADRDPWRSLAALARRLEEGTADEQPLARTAFAFSFAALIGASLSLLARHRVLGSAFTRSAAAVPAGYLGSLFVSHDRWEVRAVVIAGAAVLGFTFVVRDTRRFCGWVLLLTATAVAVLTLLASAAPDGSIAWTLGGSPLTSWRFDGIHMRFAAIGIGSILVGPPLARIHPILALVASGAVLASLAAPTAGANLTAVPVLAAGTVIAALATAAARVRWWHVPLGAAFGAGALAATMAADTGATGSPAWFAAETIRARGVDGAGDLIRARVRLNADLLDALGTSGVVAFALLAVLLGSLLVWAARASTPTRYVRGAVAGCSAAGLGLLAVSDVGLYAGGVAGSFALVAALAGAFDRPRDRAAGPSLAPTPPLDDAGRGSPPRSR